MADGPARRARWQTVLLHTTGAIVSLVLVAAIAVLVLTGTDWGRERVRRYALEQLQARVNGTVRIGRISGDLLRGMTVHDFSIRDSAGQPFVAVQAFRSRYDLTELLRRRLWFRDALLVRPLIVLDRKPDGDWNYERIFIEDTTTGPSSAGPSWGDWIRFTDARVVEGHLVVRSPWRPSRRLSPAARDSVVEEALAGRAREVVQRAPGGFQKTIELRSVTTTIPLLRLADPNFEENLLRVSSLEMTALPFHEPAAIVRDLRGEFPFDEDSIWWDRAYVRMPGSTLTGEGSYTFSSGDLTLKAHGAPAAFADLRWLYPRLPATGTGALDFEVKWRGAVQEYLAYNMDIRTGAARLAGSLGITLTDTIAIHHTDLRFSGIDTRLLEQVIPGFESPRRGVLAGSAKLDGGPHALRVTADVSFADARAGTSRFGAVGMVGMVDGGGVRADALRLRLHPFQVELLRTYMPTLPISGVVNGTATVTGSTTTGLRLAADIEHVDRGTRSAVTGTLQATGAGTDVDNWRFAAALRAHPLSLVTVGRFAPDVGLQGSVSGTIKVRGTPSRFTFDTDLTAATGGAVAAAGTVTLAGARTRYDITARPRGLNLRAFVASAPQTVLSGRVAIAGTGIEPATMRARIVADLGGSRYDDITVDEVSADVVVADGLLAIDRLRARAGSALATASGNFGLVRGRSGTLSFRVAVDSLGVFDRWIPGGGVGGRPAVTPRPGLIATAVRRAREDSARIARAEEVERMVTGKAPPRLDVRTPRSVPRDSVLGAAYAAGTVVGNIHDFDLRARAGGENVVIRGNYAQRFRADIAWTNARTPGGRLAFGLQADSLMVMGFAFDTVDARVAYANSAGHAEVVIRQGEDRDYSAVGDFTLAAGGNALRFQALRLRMDTVLWTSPRPSEVHWGGPGIRVVDFELRNTRNGRIWANGLLPTEGRANFDLAIDNLPVGDVLDIGQSDLDLTGTIDLSGRMTGTLTAPQFSGAFSLLNGVYEGTKVPRLRGTFGYEDLRLVAHLEGLRDTGTTPMVVADGRIPINLALSGVTGDRLLDAPMEAQITGDSLPVELIPHFTDVVSDMHGHVAGRLAIRGRLARPTLAGGLVIANGTATLNATGVRLESITGSLRIANDTVHVDSLVARSRGPIRLVGTVAVGSWRDPSFDLYLVADGAEVLDGEYGTIRADIGLALSGSLTRPTLRGQVVIEEGVIRAPEPTGKSVIGTDDPALFAVLDTSLTVERELFPTQPPIYQNAIVSIAIEVRRNTWVRTRDANIEVFTEYPVFVEVEDGEVKATGVVSTDRGQYNFLSKQFEVRRGSAVFVGDTDLNPTLQLSADYEVQVPSAPAMTIKVAIGGTLKRPRLSLESDAQPPKSQSELLSLLAFGRSNTSLLASGSSISGSPSGADLFGVGARLAVKRLTGVALGVMVDEVESEAGKALGTDFLNITPADVPPERLASGSGIGDLFRQTQVEAGKYVTPRAFVGLQTIGLNPGLRLEYRGENGWRFEANTEPRILLVEPTLSGQIFRTRQAYGAFILREWRF